MFTFLLHCIFFTIAAAQFPPGCRCPHSCVCSLGEGKIDCTNADLQFVPTEINSCSWPGIKKVDLSGNRITLVHEFAFSRLGNITHLFLYDNLINDVDRSALMGLESLEYLFLDDNRLTTLPYAVFWPLTRLKRLLLYENSLTSLPQFIFRYQRQLRQLSLSANRITKLDTVVFNDIPQLQELYLHNNHITELSHAPFRALRQLTVLYLHGNRLSSLTRFDFLGLNRLRRLHLRSNQISSIQDETFKPTLSLQYLYLENNRISSINILHFAGPVELLHLYISFNQISKISNGAFYRLRKLRNLYLHSNVVDLITTQTFVGLDSLRVLYLTNNRIRYVANDTFIQSPQLDHLRLGSNELVCLEEGSFRGLGNLRFLYLGNNRLSYLPEEIFSHTPKLQLLFLFSNNLRSIENHPLKNLGHLVQLNIVGNSIEYIAEGNLEGLDKLYYLEWDSTTEGGVGSLTCDCSVLWLREWLASHRVETDIICAGPREFSGSDIRSHSTASFGCDVHSLKVSITSDCSGGHVVARSGCLRLSCSSTPRGPVRWSRADGRPLRTVPDSCVSTSSCNEGSKGGGVLVVEEMGSDDVGYYICTASFQNTTVADVCQVMVGVPPVITSNVSDITKPHPGGVVKFPLTFSGNPPPTVSWERIDMGGSAHLATGNSASSRHIVSRDGYMVITDALPEDEGIYQATIRNGAGQVQANFSLSFLSPTPCGGRCLNNGTCRVHASCECQQDYGGEKCEEFTGHPVTDYASPSTLGPSQTTPTNSPLAISTTRSSIDMVSTGMATPPTTETTPTAVPSDSQNTTLPTATTVESADTERRGSGSGSGSGSGWVLEDTGSGSGSGSEAGRKCGKAGQSCDTEGLEDDEDYSKEAGRQKRMATFFTRGDTAEEQWRRWEKELKSMFREKMRKVRRSKATRQKTRL